MILPDRIKRCAHCPDLVKSRKRVCNGEAHMVMPVDHLQVLVIAEAPGMEENRSGRPLVGTSGQEARHNLNINGISRFGVYLDNVVKCHPEDNRDPTAEEVNVCTHSHLIPTIQRLQPKWIITMGRFATRWMLGDVDMEMTHGIPRTLNQPFGIEDYCPVVIPTYHPAAGLHSPEQMILFQGDMRVAGDVLRGKISPHPPMDEFAGKEIYEGVDDPGLVTDITHGFSGIAIDTEWARNGPWCLSFSVVPGQSWVVGVEQRPVLDALNVAVNCGDTTTIIHNALYDLPVLEQMGIRPALTADTMVMAYLLQNEPQGLKPLAFRHCGMKMSSYREMVGGATWDLALRYLLEVDDLTWPTPDPILEWKEGAPHVRQPQDINRKTRKILKDVFERGADPYDRWKAIKEGTDVVTELLGPIQEGELCDIDRGKAIWYSARDADATIRIFPILWERIKSLGLEDTFWRDMRMMPMVVDMMRIGMPVNLEKFAELSVYFQSRMDLIQRKIQLLVGHLMGNINVNPASYPQMSTLIYDKLALHVKGGIHKSKKGAGKKSTADDILKRYVKLHPVVQNIMDWREYQKLKTSYSDTIPKKTVRGRVHTTLRITRVATGRLASSKPNLMAQPTRSEEGRKVRDCYEASPGYKLVSGDYSQVEMRVAANESRDELMMETFWQGIDIHSQTASNMFKIPMGELDEMEHRYPAKRVGFGILNLITAEGLHRELISGGADMWTVKDCEEMIQSWFQIYSGVAKYMKRNGEEAKRYGYVRDCWGRLRYIPGIRSTNRWLRIEAERQAGNAPIQMGAQGIIKEAMGRLIPVYRKFGKDAIRPLIQIHDDIVWEVRDDCIDSFLPELHEVMVSSAPDDFILPLEVDFKVGNIWGSMNKHKRG